MSSASIWAPGAVVPTGYLLANDLANTSDVAKGDALVGVIGSLTGEVATTQHEVNGREINAFRFFSVAQRADVIARTFLVDCTSAIQACIDAAGSNLVRWPAGLYRMNSGVTTSRSVSVNWVGAGKTATEFRGSGVITAMVTLGDLVDQNIRGRIQDMCFSGSGATVQYPMFGARIEEFDFTRCWFRNATVAGCSTGYGYVINFNQCEFSYCSGSGFSTNYAYAGRANNAINFKDCLLFANTKYGLFARGGYVLTVHGCTVEQNAYAGLYLDNMAGISIQSYFEQNAVTGVTFATPAITVKSDIILTGSLADGVLDNTYPCIGVDISGCRVNVGAGVPHTSFIWNGGARDLTVTSCMADNPTDTGPCIAEHHNAIYKDSNTVITNCSTFTAPVSFTNVASAVNNTNAAYFKISDFKNNGVQSVNYAETDLNLWGVIVVANAVTYRRSTATANYALNKNPVWELVSALANTSSTYGKSVTATDYPELIGKLMWFGVWVKAAASDCFVLPYCNKQTFNANPTPAGVWTFIANSFTWPAAGTVDFGVGKAGAGVGTVFFSAPMLSVVGAPAPELLGSCYKSEQSWQGSAAPAAGTWPVRAVVWNTAPASGGTPGWVCTTAPTTFKAMAVLA